MTPQQEKQKSALQFVQQPGATVETLFAHLGGPGAAVPTYQWMHRQKLINLDHSTIGSGGDLTLTDAGVAELARLEALS